MDLKIAARTVAVITIGAGLTAAISALHDDGDRPDADAPRIVRPGGDPARRKELVRCRDLGAAALEDVACRKAWSENRRRFLRTEPERPEPPKPERFGKAQPADPPLGSPLDEPVSGATGDRPPLEAGTVTPADDADESEDERI